MDEGKTMKGNIGHIFPYIFDALAMAGWLGACMRGYNAFFSLRTYTKL